MCLVFMTGQKVVEATLLSTCKETLKMCKMGFASTTSMGPEAHTHTHTHTHTHARTHARTHAHTHLYCVYWPFAYSWNQRLLQTAINHSVDVLKSPYAELSHVMNEWVFGDSLPRPETGVCGSMSSSCSHSHKGKTTSAALFVIFTILSWLVLPHSPHRDLTTWYASRHYAYNWEVISAGLISAACHLVI